MFDAVSYVMGQSASKSAVQQAGVIEKLQAEHIPDTTQAIAFDSYGNVSSITHTDGNDNVVRTDAFTLTSNAITEVRTLSTGQSLTIETDLTTLSTTAAYAVA